MQNETNVYQIDQIREMETLAKERFGITGIEMMRNAGKAALEHLTKLWPKARRIAVICGTGNNGGDGYVLARVAHGAGLEVVVWQIGDPKKIKNDALLVLLDCENAGVSIKTFSTDFHKKADVIVDALFGIGLQGEIDHDAKQAIEAMNASKLPILAIDIPSGLDANTGSALGAAVHATATITFLGMKLGLLTGNGPAHAGKVHHHDLALPPDLYPLLPARIEKLHLEHFKKYLQPRARNTHKGDVGHVLVVGGDEGFMGAARMAAEGALRVGAGLVTVATSPKHAEFLNLTRPEIMCSGVLTAARLAPLLEKATVVVIGPGLGQSAWAKMLLKEVLQSKLPLVVDADALNLLSAKPVARRNWVLTPHPGEAGRLLKKTAAEVQQNRLEALSKLHQLYDGVCVLKGAGTLVLGPNLLPALCLDGNPGMATGGMGDVLSGVIGGLIAQGVPLADAAKLGVCLHAVAGDMAAKAGGERGMLAMDLMPYLRKLVNLDQEA
jgi:ADP-dependent NAD(P)H-hydrate dehydratase / NAD(P)H-hydrate epimerase